MISREEIQNLAELARLQLNEGEIAQLGKDISSILDYVSQIDAVQAGSSTADARPTVRNVLRADEERASADPLAGKREALLSALPKREGDYNVVRKIIQKDE